MKIYTTEWEIEGQWVPGQFAFVDQWRAILEAEQQTMEGTNPEDFTWTTEWHDDEQWGTWNRCYMEGGRELEVRIVASDLVCGGAE